MKPLIRIVIVDDHKMLAEGLSSMLADSGIAEVVGVAHSAMECRQSIPFWRPELVMLDVGLPDMSGVDYCKELKEQFPEIKILALSTHNEYAIVRQMMENGASGYLIKNAMSKEVLEGIKTVSAGQTFLCHEIDLLLKRPTSQTVWLTTRERELLRLITEGYTNNEIADKICLSPETIKGYRKNLLLKLGAKNTALLVKIALEQKLV